MSCTIAVIIPTFNRARYLREAIQSVLAQSRRPEELIVVDDGCTDDTAAVCAEFAEVRYVYQQNAGLSAARNTGIEHSTSELLMFLDDDDKLMPDALRLQSAVFEREPEVGLVYGRVLLIDAEGRRIGENLKNHRPPADHLAALLVENYIQVQTVMVRRRSLDVAGKFHVLLGEDLDLWLRMAAHGIVFRFIDEPLAEYRKFPGTMSSNKLRYAQGLLAMVEKNLLIFPATSNPLVYTAYSHYRLARAALEEQKYDLAREAMSKALRGRPGTPHFWLYWLLATCPGPLGAGVRLLQGIKRRVTAFLVAVGKVEKRWGTD
jgi:glycosyltransferase involved in cell wall biosynthesis